MFVIFAIVFSAAAVVPDAHAQQTAWRVLAREGVVRVRVGGAAHEARLNETVPVGAAITTGADSSAVLSNGLQRMTMSANSRMTISANESSGVTRIIQSLGSILFQVDHREAPHFIVDTPRLAAIVKGTTFSVVVRPRWDVVAVSNGLVDVRSRQGHSSVDVGSGRAARVSSATPDRVVLFSDAALALSEAAAPGADGLQLRAGGVAPMSMSDGSSVVVMPPRVLSQVPSWQAQFRRGDGDFLLKALLGYMAISFFLGFAAFFGFKKLDDMSRRRAERRGER